MAVWMEKGPESLPESNRLMSVKDREVMTQRLVTPMRMFICPCTAACNYNRISVHKIWHLVAFDTAKLTINIANRTELQYYGAIA